MYHSSAAKFERTFVVAGICCSVAAGVLIALSKIQ
jgi:hypothetical protein